MQRAEYDGEAFPLNNSPSLRFRAGNQRSEWADYLLSSSLLSPLTTVFIRTSDSFNSISQKLWLRSLTFQPGHDSMFIFHRVIVSCSLNSKLNWIASCVRIIILSTS